MIESMRRLSPHAVVLLLYSSLSILISWPIARHFTTARAGSGLDALSQLWIVWHGVQAFFGREPLFSTSLRYYPVGTSLLLHSAVRRAPRSRFRSGRWVRSLDTTAACSLA